MVKEKKLVFSFDASKKARFGVLPRYAKDDLLIRWFELPNCFIFHNGIVCILSLLHSKIFFYESMILRFTRWFLLIIIADTCPFVYSDC